MSNSNTKKPKIAITHGDINGVGYEVILKTFSDPHLFEVCTPILYGSSKLASAHKQNLEDVNIAFHNINKASEANEHKLNILKCVADETPLQIGKATAESGKAAYDALERACEDLKNGMVDALVTAPISKYAIQSKEFTFSGHTEYLSSQFATEEDTPLMLLTTEGLRVALATNHLPISEVASHLSVELIVHKLKSLAQSLKQDFGIRRPRIAVLALNPHSGDEGLLGNEEKDIIIPAIEQAEHEHGVLAIGPYPADGFFGNGIYQRFDAVLAMYHDQGLIPLKALDRSGGVNYTVGLPIIRTSPAHGTAFDIAGTNQAQESSFREAVFAAIDLYRQRTQYFELSANPLTIKQKQTNNKE